MKESGKIFQVLVLWICVSFLIGCSGTASNISKPENIYKTDKDKDFKSTAKIEKKKDKPLTIRACFTFDEKEVGELPIYIIPPDEAVVELKLFAANSEVEAPDRLKAYKLNPVDDPDPKARGDLFRLKKNTPYCLDFKLSDYFSAEKLSKNEFDIEARYSWNLIDPELREKDSGSNIYVCPDEQTECYTIWQGVAFNKIKIKKNP